MAKTHANNRVNSDAQKRHRFTLPLLGAGYTERYGFIEMINVWVFCGFLNPREPTRDYAKLRN